MVGGGKFCGDLEGFCTGEGFRRSYADPVCPGLVFIGKLQKDDLIMTYFAV